MRFYDGAMILVICTLAACFFGRTAARQQIDEPKYSSLDLDNIHEQKIYLKATATEEIVVVSAANGSIIDIQPNDYITHIDGVKVFSGGLTAFLLNGDSEAIIPIVDDEDLLLDGNRLLGFLKIQSFSYQQKSKKYAINLRRGEYIYDNSETALDRSLLQPGQILPQHGGGKCITSK